MGQPARIVPLIGVNGVSVLAAIEMICIKLNYLRDMIFI